MSIGNDRNEEIRILKDGHPFFVMRHSLRSFTKEKNWESLLMASQNMMSIYPEVEFGWYSYALSLLMLSEYEEAKMSFKKAIYLNSDSIDSYFHLGITNYRLGEYEEAIINYSIALKKGMNNHLIYFNLGNAHYKSNNTDNAINLYLECLSISPKFKEASNSLLEIYFDNADYFNTDKSTISIINDPRLLDYLITQAQIISKKENNPSNSDLRKAIRLLNSAIYIDDRHSVAYYERSKVKALLGDIKGHSHDKAMAFQIDTYNREGDYFFAYSPSLIKKDAGAN